MTLAPVRRGLCLVLASPSGGGKTAIAHRLVAMDENLTLSISMTTRNPRAGEQDGIDYLFRAQAAFDAMVMADGFLEYAQVFARSYGTPRVPVEAALPAGRDMVLDIDWQGHRSLRAALPGDVVSVFIMPPSLRTLEDRLRKRGDGGVAVASRMARARHEISHWAEFDHVVINEDFDRAVEQVRTILHAARLATARQHGLKDFVAGLNG
ncbi:MAG: guanylate kinase [Acetobacteraceae bacterium]|nr:guanylate kinase [Acetobacteraceae bacterium]